jgi:hypothetical protein
VFVAKFFGGLVAVFLEDVNLAGKVAKDADGAREFFGFGGELCAGFGFEEELGEFGGNKLEADFGELGGVVGAEVREEVVVEETGFEGAVLCDAPVTIATAGFPVGEVAFGDFELEFVEGLGDSGMGDVVAEHAVDHVARGERQVGDFAVAGARGRRRWMIGLVNRWIDGRRGGMGLMGRMGVMIPGGRRTSVVRSGRRKDGGGGGWADLRIGLDFRFVIYLFVMRVTCCVIRNWWLWVTVSYRRLPITLK